jgi:predicted MFS family arabinose efflux permease
LLIVSFNSLFSQQEVVKATALITLVSSISRMLSTAVTGMLNNWRGYFFAFFLSALVAGVSILLMIPITETRRPPKRPSLQRLARLVTRKDVLLPSILGLIVQYVVWGTTFGFFPLLAKQLGASEVTLSMLVSMNVAVVIFGNLATTTIVPKVGARRMAAVSFLVHAAGIGLASFAPSLSVVFAAQFLAGCASGVNYPLLMGMSIQYVAEHERATAMGLHQAVYAIGMFSGPWLSGILADSIGMRPMFAITGIGCAVLGIAGTRWLSAERDSK